MTASSLQFPFSAVVGQEDVKLALILNAIDPAIGGVVLRGQKGSAKSTLARGLATLLPGDAPFVELPVGATEDRLVGSFDLRVALTEGVRRFTPGLLASAHGGVLYVDEVNLLPDHLVDVLLDVAASGVNRVERDGVSEEHPSRFVLAGSMNPEEGELRPQLLDRFGLCVSVVASSDPSERAEAVARRLSFDGDPVGFVADWKVEEGRLKARLREVASTVKRGVVAAVPESVRIGVSVLCAEMGVEGLRADIVICRAAAALALWDEREVASMDDVARVAPLALSHRRRRSPLERHGVEAGELAGALEAARGMVEPSRGGGGGGGGDRREDHLAAGGEAPPAVLPESSSGASRGTGGELAGRRLLENSAEPTPSAARLHLGGQSPAERRPGFHSSSRGRAVVEAPRGRAVGSKPATGLPGSIAISATLTAAADRIAGLGAPALRSVLGSRASGAGTLAVAPEDLREQVRMAPVERLVVVVLDASGSMGVERRVAAAKSAVSGMLMDAYSSRDRVALVAFAGQGAEVVMTPTGSMEVAAQRLDSVSTGGTTPLAEGILAGLDLALGSSRDRRPFVALVTDGRASWARDGGDPLESALAAARKLRESRIAGTVFDAETGRVRLGLASRIASEMGVPCLPLEGLVEALLPERSF